MSTSSDVLTMGDPTLAGSLHAPDGPAIATILMVPGSGPTDRDNGAYFPPIRNGLLAAGFAVASFDKRGVGGSDGDWHDTDPERQAGDVAAQLASIRARLEAGATTIGLFGHSQGGWVALDVAAADPTIAFVVTNSGPGVTWARQGRYATAAHLRATGVQPEAVARAVDAYDGIMAMTRAGLDFDAILAAAERAGLADLGPADAAELELARHWLDHDPRVALERLDAPLLALFGGADLVVPVDESVAAFEAARRGRPGELTIEIFDGADHRLRVGQPPRLHPDYLATLVRWLRRIVR